MVRISSLDSSWSLFRPEKMPVADGERLRVTGKIPGLRVSGGDRLQVASVTGALRDGVQSQPGSETGRSAAEGDAERRGFPGYPHDTV
ncbi:hypothetical protein [Escherichia coli]|uniref:hypothetical protein n=1 Tax=Escherichia coli TaxID=562 RepID=UPI00207CEBB5|nr:hypothetical protein [Escherichia coli]